MLHTRRLATKRESSRLRFPAGQWSWVIRRVAHRPWATQIFLLAIRTPIWNHLPKAPYDSLHRELEWRIPSESLAAGASPPTKSIHTRPPKRPQLPPRIVPEFHDSLLRSAPSHSDPFTKGHPNLTTNLALT